MPKLNEAIPRVPEGAVALTLDLGGISAYCALVAGHTPSWGHENFVKGSPPAGRVFSAMGKWVDGLINYFAPALIAFESPYVPRFGKQQARLKNGETIGNLPGMGAPGGFPGIPFNNDVIRRLYGFPAIVYEHADRHQVGVHELSTQKVCRFFTGRGSWGGRDKKKAATMRVCRAFGFAVESFDEADAVACAAYLEALIWPRISERRGVGPLFMPVKSRMVIDSRT